MDWARMLAYVTGTVDQELLARNEYLTAENRILKANYRLKLHWSVVPSTPAVPTRSRAHSG
jgi:putative transposase